MNRNRAAEIIAAFGGDAARWPEAERAAALQLVLDDRELGRARAEARTLDTMLVDWAQRDVDGGDAGAMAARALAVPNGVRRRWPSTWRLAVGSGVAAMLAVGVMLTNPATAPQRVATAPAAVTDEQAFAMLFTPTSDEDGAI